MGEPKDAGEKAVIEFLANPRLMIGTNPNLAPASGRAINLPLLALPFEAEQIEWRLAQSGSGKDGKVWAKCLAYIQSRAIMDRLDEVCGPENWRVRFRIDGNDIQPIKADKADPAPIQAGVICTLGIRVNGEWIEKEDGAEQTDFEPFKGGLSGAIKRAAVQWGLGRYLYGLEEGWAETSATRTSGWRYGELKDKTKFYWNPPTLPAWALPSRRQAPSQNSTPSTTPSKPPESVQEQPSSPTSTGPSAGPTKPSPVSKPSSPSSGPKPKAGPKPVKVARGDLNRRFSLVYGDFIVAFPVPDFPTLLRQRYKNETGTKDLTDEQMEDLIKFVELKMAERVEDDVPNFEQMPAHISTPAKPVVVDLQRIKAFMDLTKSRKWSNKQVADYVQAAFGVKSVKELAAQRLTQLESVVKAATFAQAMDEVNATGGGR